MKYIVWGKTLLLLAIVSGSALVQPMQAVSLFCKAPTPNCRSEQLSELLDNHDYGQLSACIVQAMRSGDAAVVAEVMNWMELQSAIEAPLLLYKSARITASTATSLAMAGDAVSAGDDADVLPELVKLIKFCLYYYIDSVICLRAAARAIEDPMERAALLDGYARELGKKSAEIFARVAAKWDLLMASDAARPGSYLAVGEAMQRAWRPEALSSRLHCAPWVFGVSRNVHWGTTAHRTAKWLVGSWLSTNEPGGLEFNTYDGPCHAYLALVPDEKLLRWYAELRINALALLERHATASDFFITFNVSDLLAAEVTILKFGKRQHSGLTASEPFVFPSVIQAHGNATAAAGGNGLPCIPRLQSCGLATRYPLEADRISRRPVTYPPLPPSVENIAAMAQAACGNSLQSFPDRLEGGMSPGAPCFGSPLSVEKDGDDNEFMPSTYAVPLSQSLQTCAAAMPAEDKAAHETAERMAEYGAMVPLDLDELSMAESLQTCAAAMPVKDSLLKLYCMFNSRAEDCHMLTGAALDECMRDLEEYWCKIKDYQISVLSKAIASIKHPLKNCVHPRESVSDLQARLISINDKIKILEGKIECGDSSFALQEALQELKNLVYHVQGYKNTKEKKIGFKAFQAVDTKTFKAAEKALRMSAKSEAETYLALVTGFVRL